MNDGTKILKRTLDVFKDMSIKEYEKLYDKAKDKTDDDMVIVIKDNNDFGLPVRTRTPV